MTASERFRRYPAGETVDRAPCIEWAPRWHLTLERWRGEGLPPEVSLSTYRDYVALLYEYAAKVTHGGENILPCPVFCKELFTNKGETT